jgi:hypothetical protein
VAANKQAGRKEDKGKIKEREEESKGGKAGREERRKEKREKILKY